LKVGYTGPHRRNLETWVVDVSGSELCLVRNISGVNL